MVTLVKRIPHFTLNDENLKKKAEVWVNGVLANQDEDGYIGTYFGEDNRNEDYNPWGTNWAMRSLLSYYEATDRQDVLEACHRALLWYVNNWVGHRLCRTNYHRINGIKVFQKVR